MESIDPFFIGGLTIPTATHFEERLESLKVALYDKTPGSIVEEAKALLECVYRTIIIDHSGEVAPGRRGQPTFPELYMQAKACLSLSDDLDISHRVDEACLTITRTIGQIRNSNGSTSHGQDAYTENRLGIHEAHFIAREALSIAAFFLNRHSISETHLRARLRFEDHNNFNESIDDSQEWPIIMGQEMRPSEVLFNTDPTRYREALIEYHENSQND